MHVQLSKLQKENKIQLLFENKGATGVVYHVYDLNHLERIPRRYTVEAEKSLSDQWDTTGEKGLYDLEVYGPNGYFQKFSGNVHNKNEPEITLDYDHRKGGVSISIYNTNELPVNVEIHSNAYNYGDPFSMEVAPGKTRDKTWDLKSSGNWYDFSVKMEGYLYRFAGRVETGKPAVSDPAMAFEI